MRPLLSHERDDSGRDAPYYEADDFAWLDEPTAKCDGPNCFVWFRADRKCCPACRFPRRRKR